MAFVQPVNEKTVKPLIGQLVCAVMHDGTYYIGTVRHVSGGDVILQGYQGKGSISADPHTAKPQISGLGSLFGMANGLFGSGQQSAPGGIFSGAGGGAGGGGFLSKWGPMLKLGMGMLSFLFPLLSKFSI